MNERSGGHFLREKQVASNVSLSGKPGQRIFGAVPVDEVRQSLESALGSGYRLERELGGGGMSRVFVATDLTLGRKIVVKLLKPESGAGVSAERFRREIEVASRTQHPHIVPLLHAGDAGGIPYFTMPFVEGESLRTHLSSGARMPFQEAVRILREIAAALAYAHARGIVHRDIKPENVLLSSGAAMVTDFGIAKAVSAARTEPSTNALTHAGTSLGTPAYMAPEQATGDAVDARSDIYSWGIVAYEMIAGRHPFADKTTSPKMIAAQISEAPPPVLPQIAADRSVPPGAREALARLVMRSIEKDPAQRPQSASDIADELSSLGAGSGTKGKTRTVLRRRLWIAAASAAVVIVAAGVIAKRKDAASLEEKRVVVATFENRTGDKSLDSYGPMAADWIARGLTGSGMVDVAGTAAELVARGATTTDVGPSQLHKLATDAGAGLIISGAYYKQGDSVLFEADFTDANANKLLQSVGPLSAPVARPLDAVGPLRQRVMASLSTLLDPGLAGLAGQLHLPPSPEAYQEYLAGEDVFYRDDGAALTHFARAAALDSSFVYPLMRSMNILTNHARMAEADSVGSLLSRHASAMTDYEREYVILSNAIAHGDQEAVYVAAGGMMRAAPRSAFAAYARGIGSVGSGRPHEADSILQRLDPNGGVMRGRIYYFSNYSVTLHALGDYPRQLDVVRRGETLYPHRLFLIADEVMALCALGRVSEANQRIADATAMSADLSRSGATVIRIAIHELRYHGHDPAADTVAARWTPWLMQRSRDSTSIEEKIQVALALQAAGEWKAVRQIADSLEASGSKDPYVIALGGDARAQLGDRAGALAAAKRIEAITSPIGHAQRLEARSWISIALGDSADALRLFRQSSPPGSLDGEAGHGTWLFDRLRNYTPLKAYVVPRG
jgi:hypothetical protein